MHLCADTLVHLNIAGCFQIDDAHLIRILTMCPLLVRLNIKNCRKLTDKVLNELTRRRISLLELNIGQLDSIETPCDRHVF